mgnify:CR=1 FL=1
MEMNHVLVVEDDKEIREGVEIYLKSQGYEVFQAADGAEGLDVIEREDIHLAIVDIMMPVMDGYEAARRIRKLADPVHANKPIIAMTAYAFEEDVKAALAAGMNEHLSKPIRIELLYEIMKKYL